MTPDVATALADIRSTCDWMHTTKKVGGLGYSIVQVQKTKAYAAVVALGGTWPTVGPTPPPPTPKPGNGEYALDMRPASGNLQLGESPDGHENTNAQFAGPNLTKFNAADRGIMTMAGFDEWLEFTLRPGDHVPGPGPDYRYMISSQGYDKKTPGYPGGHPSANTPEGFLNGGAWHYDGEDYTYGGPFVIPTGTAAHIKDVGPTILEIAHACAVIDGAWPSSYYTPAYHGHEATGLLLAANRADIPQQFTPRPGDDFCPDKNDFRPYIAFKMGYGDVTSHDNIYTWAICLADEDVTFWPKLRLLKRDDAQGMVQVWMAQQTEPTGGQARAALAGQPNFTYTGPTSQFVAGAAPWDPASPRSSMSDNPQRLTQMPVFTLGFMGYAGSVNPPVPFTTLAGGIVRCTSPGAFDAFLAGATPR